MIRQGSNKEMTIQRIQNEKEPINWYRIKNGIPIKDFTRAIKTIICIANNLDMPESTVRKYCQQLELAVYVFEKMTLGTGYIVRMTKKL
ncbi:hypothetical protein ABGT24_08760 [Peribacillus frigoritolerans]|uniref:hypothetical protein n=1 Tax=Peribacillus frigoritolerans TaxID=450367 RepID=UPI00345DD1BC